MRTKSSVGLFSVVVASALAPFAGCSATEEDPFGNAAGGTSGAAGLPAGGAGGSGGSGGIAIGGGGGVDASPADIQSIEVTPAQASLDIDNGDVTGKSVSFSAKAKLFDGSFVPLSNCEWTIDDFAVGTLKGSTFLPSGDAGGVAAVTCTVGVVSGSGKVSVKLHELTNAANLDPSAIASLIGAQTPDPNLKQLSYPYDQTVFPRGLFEAPELMWEATGPNDVYAVAYREEFAEVVVTFTSPNPGRFRPDLPLWNKVLESNSGKQVEVTLYRLAGGKSGTPYQGPKQTWTLATANLKGSVTYWRVLDKDSGDIVRMPFGQPPQPFLQSNGSCTGCHALSRNGKTVAAATTASGYAGAFDGASGAKLFESGTQSGYRAVSPDGDVIAWVPALGSNNYLGEPVELADATSGSKISPSGMEGFGLTSTPSFSADGKRLAFAVRKPPHDQTQHNIFNNSDLAIADFDPVTKQASNMKTLVATSNSDALVFPSFTPDDQRVVYQRSNGVRSRGVTLPGWNWTSQQAKGDLWIVGADGTNAVRLANADSAGLGPGEELHNFHPITSPVVQGGYFWVVFTSTRVYGNRLTVTGDYNWNHCVDTNFVDCRKKQLWVAAIDINAPAGVDPSHPAFRLPGQELDTENFDAFWSLDACKPTNADCDVGFECCDGVCTVQNGKKVCGGTTSCSAAGDSCNASSDCCSGLFCVGGVCDFASVK